MEDKLHNVLFITGGFPSSKNPNHCPFIGYRLAYLQKYGVQADILSLVRISWKEHDTYTKKIISFLISFIPVFTFEKYHFLGKDYKIFKIYYGCLSRIWIPIIVLILIKLNNYSLAHYHFLWFANELPLLKRVLNFPSVITVHGSDMHETAVNDPISYIMFKKAVLHADKVIYVSSCLRKISESIHLATKKDIIIPNGYDPKTFFPPSENSSKLTLGFVGHLYEVKRADKLPKIFMHIKERIPDARLIIVGGGEKQYSLESYIKTQLKEYGIINDVYFSGEVNPTDVAEYYRLMDILLLPSRNEGFPCVAIEARACGVPVVGSSNGGIPESVGEGGIIVLEGENFETRFADAVVKLSKMLPLKGDIARGVFDYNWDLIIKKEVDVYTDVLNNNLR